MTRLLVTWSGGTTSFDPGSTVRIGRDLGVELRLENANVSRRHAEIVGTRDGWVLRDLGSAQGTWLDGRSVDEVEIRGTMRVTLGREGRGEVVTLEAESVGPTASDVPGTVIVGQRNTGATPVVESDGTVVVGSAGGSRPGGALRAFDQGATIVKSDTLTIECGGRLHTFEPHHEVTVGRQVDNDVVTTNPTVSRHHARIAHDGSGWTLYDEGSARGTFVDGVRVTEHRLAGSAAVWLGDPTAGERLVIVAPGQSTGRSATGRRRTVLGALAATTLLLVIAVIIIFVRSGDGATSDADLARATVRLEFGNASGSGTIVDADQGLVLTTAQLVAPDAPGVAIRRLAFDSELASAPRRIRVLVSPDLGRPAEPRFLAEVVAVDGYLDLAVLKVTETVGGGFIEPGGDEFADLRAVALAGGDAAPGDAVRVFGYPVDVPRSGAAVLDGVVSSLLRDDRIGSNRAMLGLSVPVDTGSSGGPAVVDDGRVVGIARTEPEDGAVGARPVELAEGLIEAARRDEPYASPWYRLLTTEQVTEVRAVAPADRPGLSFGCGSSAAVPNGARSVGVAFGFERFTVGEHQDLLVEVKSGDEVLGRRGVDAEYPLDWPSEDGCGTVTVPLTRRLAEGEAEGLTVRVGIGPSYVDQP